MFYLFTYYPLYNFKKLYEKKEEALSDLQAIIKKSLEFWSQDGLDETERNLALKIIFSTDDKKDCPSYQVVTISDEIAEPQKYFRTINHMYSPSVKIPRPPKESVTA